MPCYCQYEAGLPVALLAVLKHKVLPFAISLPEMKGTLHTGNKSVFDTCILSSNDFEKCSLCLTWTFRTTGDSGLQSVLMSWSSILDSTSSYQKHCRMCCCKCLKSRLHCRVMCACQQKIDDQTPCMLTI